MGRTIGIFLLKNRLWFVVAGILIAFLSIIHIESPAFAITLTGPGINQQNNQSYHGVNSSGNHTTFVGRHQANTGNPGVNHGFNQDDSGNAGNQVSGQRKAIGVQRNNQFLRQGSGSGSGNTTNFIGAGQGNSGNEGINLGNSQDNAGNSGNQVNNQGNIIGTQVNKQGSSVVNDGNIIEHQVNYVNLLPGVGVYVSVRPKLQFAVSLGN